MTEDWVATNERGHHKVGKGRSFEGAYLALAASCERDMANAVSRQSFRHYEQGILPLGEDLQEAQGPRFRPSRQHVERQ